MNFQKIYLQKGYEGREAFQIRQWNNLQNENRLVYTDATGFDSETLHNNLFIGSVEYIESILKHRFVADYFPSWVVKQSAHHRVVARIEDMCRYPYWVKPFFYKSFDSFKVYSQQQLKDSGISPPFFVAPVYEGPFRAEWRYYIANGKVLAAEWYKGLDDIETPPPPIPAEIPDYYCGAVDFGYPYYYNEYQPVPIEAHHPFSCGWYGFQKDLHNFLDWAWIGWQYVLKIKN
jgi:hypothetical protein